MSTFVDLQVAFEMIQVVPKEFRELMLRHTKEDLADGTITVLFLC